MIGTGIILSCRRLSLLVVRSCVILDWGCGGRGDRPRLRCNERGPARNRMFGIAAGRRCSALLFPAEMRGFRLRRVMRDGLLFLIPWAIDNRRFLLSIAQGITDVAGWIDIDALSRIVKLASPEHTEDRGHQCARKRKHREEDETLSHDVENEH